MTRLLLGAGVVMALALTACKQEPAAAPVAPAASAAPVASQQPATALKPATGLKLMPARAIDMTKLRGMLKPPQQGVAGRALTPTEKKVEQP